MDVFGIRDQKNCLTITLEALWLCSDTSTSQAHVGYNPISNNRTYGSRRLDLWSNSSIFTYGKKVPRIGPQTLFWGGVTSPFNFPSQLAHLSLIWSIWQKSDFPFFSQSYVRCNSNRRLAYMHWFLSLSLSLSLYIYIHLYIYICVHTDSIYTYTSIHIHTYTSGACSRTTCDE